MRYYLGVDVGTFETKGILVDAGGRIVASAALKRQGLIVPRPGWAEHDAQKDWWESFCHVSRRLLADSGLPPTSIAAIGCSAIGPCMLPVDGDGEALTNAVLYGIDGRAAGEIAELTAAIGEDVLLDRCGNALTSQSIGPKILWLRRNHPEIFERAAKIVTSTTYLVQKLTGACVVDHYTAANFSPLYLADEQRWSSALAGDIVGLEKLADPAWTTDVAGTVTRRAAAGTGLAEGTPVIVGTIDAAAEALSVGALSPGDMMVMYGSTIFTIMPTAGRLRDGRLWYAPWLFPGEHASMAGLSTSGTLTHWFRDQLARDLPADTAFATLSAEAGTSPPGANGLIVLPYFSGERTPIHDPYARGTVFGLDLTHTRGDLYRATLEGIAFGTNHILETYAEIGQPPARLLAVGGGVQNAVWTQATSDISGLEQVVRRHSIGASLGDALLAAIAVGDAVPETIEAWNPVERVIAPRPETADTYARQFSVYKRLYDQTRGLMAELTAIRGTAGAHSGGEA